MAREESISSNPADAEVGGFLDDVDGTITAFEATTFDYDGKYDESPAIRMVVDVDDGDEVEQYLSAGQLKRIRPKKDGSGFCRAPNSRAKGLGATANATLFLASLVNAGFPAKKLEDYDNVVGLNAHFVAVPQPKRSGLADDEDDARPRSVVNVSEIHSMPGEGKKTKRKRPRPVEEDEDETEAGDEASDEVSEEVEGYITTLLKGSKHRKGISVEDLPALVLQQARKSKNKRAAVEMVQDEDWLGDDARPFSFDDDLITKA